MDAGFYVSPSFCRELGWHNLSVICFYHMRNLIRNGRPMVLKMF